MEQGGELFVGNNVTNFQEDHYYPFGMRLGGMSTDTGQENKFLYNGKELEDDLGLDIFHYGLRHYDPQLGRWMAVDPADEFFSPYVYCHNDPVNFLDPDGAIEASVIINCEYYFEECDALYYVLSDEDLSDINTPEELRNACMEYIDGLTIEDSEGDLDVKTSGHHKWELSKTKADLQGLKSQLNQDNTLTEVQEDNIDTCISVINTINVKRIIVGGTMIGTDKLSLKTKYPALKLSQRATSYASLMAGNKKVRGYATIL